MLDLTLLVNPAVDATQLPGLGDTVSAVPRSIALDDVIAVEGPRLPTSEETSHEYRVGLIYLVDPGAPFITDDLLSLEELRRFWEGSFFRHTRGRGVVDVGMHGAPAPGGTTADLPAAIAWLVGQVTASGLCHDSAVTSVRETAGAVAALGRAGGQGLVVDAAVRGLGGAQPGGTELKALQLLTLVPYGRADDGIDSTVDPAVVTAIADALVAEEDPNGGWAAFPRYLPDLVTTARVVRALAAANGTIAPDIGFITVNTVVPAQPAGDYELRFLIDPDVTIAERERGNDTAAIQLEVREHPAGVALVLDDGQIDVVPPEIAAIPQPLAVNGIVRNDGLTAGTAVAVAVFDGDPASGVELGRVTVDVPALGGGPLRGAGDDHRGTLLHSHRGRRPRAGDRRYRPLRQPGVAGGAPATDHRPRGGPGLVHRRAAAVRGRGA